MQIKFKNKIFLIITLFLFISVNYQFFFNTYNLKLNDYDKRLLKIYGHCSKEGYGFTKFVVEKYKLENNVNIVQGKSELYAPIESFFYKINKPTYKNFFILINYEDDISKNFKNYKILEKQKNCYFIETND